MKGRVKGESINYSCKASLSEIFEREKGVSRDQMSSVDYKAKV